MTQIMVLFLILFPLTAPLVATTNAQATQVNFVRTPANYDHVTGAFTLGAQLTYDAGARNGGVCVMYDYFVFNAQAGQVLRGQLQSDGTVRQFFYMILNSPYQLYGFQNSNCGVGYWGWMQGIVSPSTINWTVPKDGQYALIFMTSGFYGRVLYFTW